MSNTIQSIEVLEKQLASTKDSQLELSTIDKHVVAEQLLSFKRVSPSPVSGKGQVDKSEVKDLNTDDENITSEDEHKTNKTAVAKKRSRTKHKNDKNGRLLPKQAVAILKEWILSPEHFSFPYPTDEEKKMLMEKTGINSKQIKYWFINARRRLWKQKLVEQQQKSLPSIPNNANTANATNKASVTTTDPATSLNRPQNPFLHPSTCHNITMSPQHQAAATALLHQQMLFQQVAAANAAAAQMASNSYESSPVFQQQTLIPNTSHFLNAFLSNFLKR